jgi:hypothetical protein
MTGSTKPAMSVFEHYVAYCAIAHQRAIRAARERTPAEASELTVVLFRKMHRLEEIVAELGEGAVFAKPAEPISGADLLRLFP